MAKTVASIAARGMACVAFLAAAMTMLFAHQRSYINGCFFKTNFRDWHNFLFFDIAKFVASAYNILPLCIPSGSNMWRTVVLTDMVVAIVLLSSLAVSLETYYFLYNGSITAGWAPVCNKN